MTISLQAVPSSYSPVGQHIPGTKIVVIGVGGGGCNAVDNMITQGFDHVHFVVANTDSQALFSSLCQHKIRLGDKTTRGRGAGAKPEVGMQAATENLDEISQALDGADMCFIAAGMGGGTGTGAAPVIAALAKEKGILTIGIVTKPFTSEGVKRSRMANEGIEKLRENVHTLVVIPNQNLFSVAQNNLTIKDSFRMVDDILATAIRTVTDMITRKGLVNVDFADVSTAMSHMGLAMLGMGEAQGEGRIEQAVIQALSNPLLRDTSMSEARGLLICVTGGENMGMEEYDHAIELIANQVNKESQENVDIISGCAIDISFGDKVRVAFIASGIMPEQTRVDQSQSPYVRKITRSGAPDFSSHDAETSGRSTPVVARSVTPTTDVSNAQSFRANGSQNVNKLAEQLHNHTNIYGEGLANNAGPVTRQSRVVDRSHQPSQTDTLFEGERTLRQNPHAGGEQRGVQNAPSSMDLPEPGEALRDKLQIMSQQRIQTSRNVPHTLHRKVQALQNDPPIGGIRRMLGSLFTNYESPNHSAAPTQAPVARTRMQPAARSIERQDSAIDTHVNAPYHADEDALVPPVPASIKAMGGGGYRR